MPTAIKFENISKQYRLGLVSTNTLSHDLKRWWVTNIQGKEDPYLKIGEVNDRASKGTSDYVWALKDINFEVQQGDVLGIIGKNGAGKSTLLKILSKVTAPSTGSIKARGRIASLLEVGTGFHPEMTGRENIYMNGAIMGMTKAEITRKLDEIIDFSGVERYIDTPAKRYSSGMTVRLGFAIAAHLDPEILVVDEVLAVGDAEFQKKAIGKMQDVSKGEGRTVLFVSHNMGSMQQLCSKGMLLKDGMIAFRGSIEETISFYQETVSESSDFLKFEDRKSHGRAILKDCKLFDTMNREIKDIFSGMTVKIQLIIENNTGSDIDDIRELTVGIESLYGDVFIILNNINVDNTILLKPGLNCIEFQINKFPLSTGKYRLGFYLADSIGTIDIVEVMKVINVDGGLFYESGKFHHNSKVLVDYSIKVI
jgi:lipopolysaccharide transport system ATP-binding protein